MLFQNIQNQACGNSLIVTVSDSVTDWVNDTDRLRYLSIFPKQYLQIPVRTKCQLVDIDKTEVLNVLIQPHNLQVFLILAYVW